MMRSAHYLFYMIFILTLVPACEADRQQGENIASVNDVPIPVSEFQREVSLLSKRDPGFKITPKKLEEQLNTIIDKKLLIQEAMKKGLAEDPRFADTIKTFWEQTLIRELVDAKAKEWADKLFVTEDEIGRDYKRMQYMPVVKAVRAKNKEQAEEFRAKLLKGLQIAGAETIGPLYLEDVRSEALLNAFDMNMGEVRTYESDGEYIVIQVVKKEKAAVPSFKESYSRIKAFLMERKKQDAMEKWLKDVKSSAKININARLLKEIADER